MLARLRQKYERVALFVLGLNLLLFGLLNLETPAVFILFITGIFLLCYETSCTLVILNTRYQVPQKLSNAGEVIHMILSMSCAITIVALVINSSPRVGFTAPSILEGGVTTFSHWCLLIMSVTLVAAFIQIKLASKYTTEEPGGFGIKTRTILTPAIYLALGSTVLLTSGLSILSRVTFELNTVREQLYFGLGLVLLAFGIMTVAGAVMFTVFVLRDFKELERLEQKLSDIGSTSLPPEPPSGSTDEKSAPLPPKSSIEEVEKTDINTYGSPVSEPLFEKKEYLVQSDEELAQLTRTNIHTLAERFGYVVDYSRKDEVVLVSKTGKKSRVAHLGDWVTESGSFGKKHQKPWESSGTYNQVVDALETTEAASDEDRTPSKEKDGSTSRKITVDLIEPKVRIIAMNIELLLSRYGKSGILQRLVEVRKPGGTIQIELRSHGQLLGVTEDIALDDEVFLQVESDRYFGMYGTSSYSIVAYTETSEFPSVNDPYRWTPTYSQF